MLKRDWTTGSNYANRSRLDKSTWFYITHLMNIRIFTFVMSSNIFEANGYEHNLLLGFATYLVLIACFISYKKWVHTEKYLTQIHVKDLPHHQMCHTANLRWVRC